MTATDVAVVGKRYWFRSRGAVKIERVIAESLVAGGDVRRLFGVEETDCGWYFVPDRAGAWDPMTHETRAVNSKSS